MALDRTVAKVGQTIAVSLSGFPAGSVAVELCGNGGRRGTADCALTSSVTTYVGEGKGASVSLAVARPPIDCPCVVSVHPVAGGNGVTTPITLTGVPVLSEAQRATAAASGSRALTATKVAISGGGSWGEWFLGSARRTLRLTLRNDGTAALTDPALSLAVGRGASPTGIVEAPPLGTLAPGATRTYDIPFTVAGPAFGRYTVRGEITGLDEPIAFSAETATYPWAFPLLALLAVPLPLLRRRRTAAPKAAPVLAGLTMNQIVAGNLAHWRRLQDRTLDDLAAALTAHSAYAWTAAGLGALEDTWAAEETRAFDANDLLAISRALAIPLPALLVAPPEEVRRSR